VNLNFHYRDRFDLVSGLEVRNGVIQGNFVSVSDCVPVPSTFENVSDYRALSDDQFFEYFDRLVALIFRTGFGGRCTPAGQPAQFGDAVAGEHFTVRDLGLFAQASYKPVAPLKFIGGLRVDNNQIRPNGGFGTQMNPRVGVVFAPRPSGAGRMYALKALYSEAFQDASSFEKYSTIPGVRETASPNLQPEKARNIELSAGGKWGPLTADIAGYRASYSNRVALKFAHLADDPEVDAFLPGVFDAILSDAVVGNLIALLNDDNRKVAAERILHDPMVTERYENIGRQRVWGLQASTSYAWRRYTLFGNYTFSNPVDLDPTEGGRRLKDESCEDVTSLRTPDIAQHRANAGVNARGGKWNVNVRINAVGARPTMQSRLTLIEETRRCVTAGLVRSLRDFLESDVDTLSAQLGGAPVDKPFLQQPYTIAHAAVSYDPTPRLGVQLTVNNLFNKAYAHPGPLNADGVRWPTHVPQAPRAAFVQLLTRF
jgi:outer membrane receptor protein involved in Fe transport